MDLFIDSTGSHYIGNAKARNGLQQGVQRRNHKYNLEGTILSIHLKSKHDITDKEAFNFENFPPFLYNFITTSKPQFSTATASAKLKPERTLWWFYCLFYNDGPSS